jgi:hypothetical protein
VLAGEGEPSFCPAEEVLLPVVSKGGIPSLAKILLSPGSLTKHLKATPDRPSLLPRTSVHDSFTHSDEQREEGPKLLGAALACVPLRGAHNRASYGIDP